MKTIGNNPKWIDSIRAKINQEVTIPKNSVVFDTASHGFVTLTADWRVVVSGITRAVEVQIGAVGWNGELFYYNLQEPELENIRLYLGQKITQKGIRKRTRQESWKIMLVLREILVTFRGPDQREYDIELTELLS